MVVNMFEQKVDSFFDFIGHIYLTDDDSIFTYSYKFELHDGTC